MGGQTKKQTLSKSPAMSALKPPRCDAKEARTTPRAAAKSPFDQAPLSLGVTPDALCTPSGKWLFTACLSEVPKAVSLDPLLNDQLSSMGQEAGRSPRRAQCFLATPSVFEHLCTSSKPGRSATCCCVRGPPKISRPREFRRASSSGPGF